MLRAIQRHRDVQQDNTREFRRTKVRRAARLRVERLIAQQASVKQALDQMNLLSGVRNDIEYGSVQSLLAEVALTTTRLAHTSLPLRTCYLPKEAGSTARTR